jgi:hypothetical protein
MHKATPLILKEKIDLSENKAVENFPAAPVFHSGLSPVANTFCGQDCEQAQELHLKILIQKKFLVALNLLAEIEQFSCPRLCTFFVDNIVRKDFATWKSP